jgi:hypothetical protein
MEIQEPTTIEHTEQPVLADKLVQPEPFVERQATPAEITEIVKNMSEKGPVDAAKIDALREDIAKGQFASPEKIAEVTEGKGDNGFATPEQVNAATTVALDQAGNSMAAAGRLDASIAMQNAQPIPKEKKTGLAGWWAKMTGSAE